MKIVLLSNVTVEVLARFLRKEHQVWMPSGFSAWMEAALEPPLNMLFPDKRKGFRFPIVHGISYSRFQQFTIPPWGDTDVGH